MKRYIFSFYCILSSLFALHAQLPDDYRSEQIYLAPQKAAVMQGDSIDVEGIVTSLAGDNVRPYSRYLYVELIGDADTAMVRSKVACEPDGRFSVRIPTDPLDPRGVYYLRAYTRLMRNFSPESFAIQPVMVGRQLPADDGIIDDNTSLSVYPSGGVLAAGRPQNVVAYLTTGQGFPIQDKTITLSDAQGKTLAEAKTSPSGLATLSFVPAEGNTYNFTFSDSGVNKTCQLTPQPAGTPKVEGSVNGNKIVFNIDGDVTGKRLIVYDRANGLSEASIQGNQGSIALPVTPNTATLFLTDSEGDIIAQTTVVSRQAATPFEITLPSAVAAGSPIEFTLPQDSTLMISARVLGADDLMSGHAQSALLYLTDFSSPLPFPQRYYTSDGRTRAEDLQAWLSTATFKRFTPKEVLNESGSQLYAFMPEMNMIISGQVYRSKENPFRGGRIVAYNSSTDCVYDTVIGPDGRFVLAVDNFPQGTEFFLQPINDKGKASRSEVRIDDDTFPAAVIDRSGITGDSRYLAADVTVGKGNALNSRELANVVVKAHVKSEPKSTEQFYATRYKDREEIERKGYHSLRDIIRDMPFLRMQRVNNGWILATTRSAYSLGQSGTLIPIMIDGMLFGPDEYASMIEMPVTDIESVEHLTPTQAINYTADSMNGLLYIKTRNRGTSLPSPSKGTIVTPIGLDTDAVAQTALTAPTVPGRYRVAVDAIGNDGEVYSTEKWIEVK